MPHETPFLMLSKFISLVHIHETSLSLVAFRNADNYWNRWALEISTFWGPEMAPGEVSAIWAQSTHRAASGRENRSIICITFTSCKVTRGSTVLENSALNGN